jgi:hypothetical protein
MNFIKFSFLACHRLILVYGVLGAKAGTVPPELLPDLALEVDIANKSLDVRVIRS